MGLPGDFSANYRASIIAGAGLSVTVKITSAEPASCDWTGKFSEDRRSIFAVGSVPSCTDATGVTSGIVNIDRVAIRLTDDNTGFSDHFRGKLFLKGKVSQKSILSESTCELEIDGLPLGSKLETNDVRNGGIIERERTIKLAAPVTMNGVASFDLDDYVAPVEDVTKIRRPLKVTKQVPLPQGISLAEEGFAVRVSRSLNAFLVMVELTNVRDTSVCLSSTPVKSVENSGGLPVHKEFIDNRIIAPGSNCLPSGARGWAVAIVGVNDGDTNAFTNASVMKIAVSETAAVPLPSYPRPSAFGGRGLWESR